jgi:hypothetical protein
LEPLASSIVGTGSAATPGKFLEMHAKLREFKASFNIGTTNVIC